MSGEMNGNQIQPDQGKSNNHNGLKVVGFNLLALAFYTVLCKLANDVGSLMAEAFLVGGQVLACLIVSAVRREPVWLLSAFLVLIIGFSTCVYAGEFSL